MQPDRIDRGQATRLARLVQRMLEPCHLHFVLQLHPRPRALAGLRLVRQPDLDIASRRPQRRSTGKRTETRPRYIPAQRLRRLDREPEILDQRLDHIEENAGFFMAHAERRRIDQDQVISRYPHVHGLDARPHRVAGRAAIGEQHIGRERGFVAGGVGIDHAELAGDPALVRQRALEIFTDHPLVERGPGKQPVEGGTLQVVKRGGGVRSRWQRERQQEVKVVKRHDAAHCMANFALDPR
jgi:hypothetical protein